MAIKWKIAGSHAIKAALFLFSFMNHAFAQNHQIKINNFDSIELDGNYSLNFQRSSQYSITIKSETGTNFLDVSASANILKIKDIHNAVRENHYEVKISAPQIKSIFLMGNYQAKLNEMVNKDFSLKLDGHGKVTLKGKIDNLFISSKGTTSIDSRTVCVTHLELNFMGTANIAACVINDGILDRKIFGSSSIEIYGRPKLGKTSDFGVSNIEFHDIKERN